MFAQGILYELLIVVKLLRNAKKFELCYFTSVSLTKTSDFWPNALLRLFQVLLLRKLLSLRLNWKYMEMPQGYFWGLLIQQDG